LRLLCVLFLALRSLSISEEFRLEAKGLPEGYQEAQIEEIFSRYGQLRSIQKIFGTKGGGGGEDGAPPGGEEGSAFRVEYFNIQVRRRRKLVHAISHLCITLTDPPTLPRPHSSLSVPALPLPYLPTSSPSEGRASRGVGAQRHLYHAGDALSRPSLFPTYAPSKPHPRHDTAPHHHTTQLGPAASVTFAPLDSRKQQLCRQLLATLSRWRSELAPAMAVGLGGGSPHHQVRPAMVHALHFVCHSFLPFDFLPPVYPPMIRRSSTL